MIAGRITDDLKAEATCRYIFGHPPHSPPAHVAAVAEGACRG
jgi:hypothetical protein